MLYGKDAGARASEFRRQRLTKRPRPRADSGGERSGARQPRRGDAGGIPGIGAPPICRDAQGEGQRHVLPGDVSMALRIRAGADRRRRLFPAHRDQRHAAAPGDVGGRRNLGRARRRRRGDRARRLYRAADAAACGKRFGGRPARSRRHAAAAQQPDRGGGRAGARLRPDARRVEGVPDLRAAPARAASGGARRRGGAWRRRRAS